MSIWTTFFCTLIDNKIKKISALSKCTAAALLSPSERRIVFIKLLVRCPRWTPRAAVSLGKTLDADVPTSSGTAQWIRAQFGKRKVVELSVRFLN